MLQQLSASRALIEGVLRGPTTVVWRHDMIVEVRIARHGDDVYDGILAPGFIDTQVNGVGEDSVVDDDLDVSRLGHALRAQGVTSWLPTIPTQDPSFYEEGVGHVTRKFADEIVGLPHALGLHFEGPFLGRRPGAHQPEWFAVGEEILDVFKDARMVTIAPEHPIAPRAISALTAAQVVVAIGHSAPTDDEFEEAIACGCRHVTHLFNAMSGVHHVEPGLANSALVDDRLTFSVIADLVHVHPKTLSLIWKAAGDRMILVSDQVARQNQEGLDGARLRGAQVGLDVGVRNLVQECGVPLEDALLMASSRPATLLGLSDRGVLRHGRRADLVLLSDDIDVCSVVCGGFTWLADAN